MREKQVERVEGALLSASARGEKAEFRIAQYEFSPVCGMQ